MKSIISLTSFCKGRFSSHGDSAFKEVQLMIISFRVMPSSELGSASHPLFNLRLAEFIKIILHCSLDHFKRVITIINLFDLVADSSPGISL